MEQKERDTIRTKARQYTFHYTKEIQEQEGIHEKVYEEEPRKD